MPQDDDNIIDVEPSNPGLVPLRGGGDGLVKLTHVIYGLHTLSVLIGVTTAATIVGSFVFGLPSILAVILNYIKRGDVRGTWLDSHFSWQIRTFWFALLWCVVIAILMLTIVGIPVALIGLLVVGVWVVYRIARGWLVLKERRPLDS
ncbi:DUF4870 family protein [Uliginosibacterium sp. sgz301328]|uniref:DUF4870 family protein n=1 Tax=Uliginosibacterium sp. sgz301328 TaxID=3243764 RepID=UPI00359CF884